MSVRFVVDDSGQPTEVLLDLSDYESLLDRAEDAESLELVRKMHAQPLDYVSLDSVADNVDTSVATHKIVLDARAAEQFRGLADNARQPLLEQVEQLMTNPRPASCRRVVGGDQLFRLHNGDYRIVYEVHDRDNRLVIYGIGHRSEVY